LVCPPVPGHLELLTWKAVALKSEVTSLAAGASVDTGRGCTRHIGAVTVLACEALGALALIGTGQVEAGAPMLAVSWNVTLIDIGLAFLSCEARKAPAGELVSHSGTGTSICTGVRQAGVSPLAQLPYKKDNRLSTAHRNKTQPYPQQLTSYSTGTAGALAPRSVSSLI
jgi:hypothetical protein